VDDENGARVTKEDRPTIRAQRFNPGIRNHPGSRLEVAAGSTAVAVEEQVVGHRVGSQSADKAERCQGWRTLLVLPGIQAGEQSEALR
jgi:hypothetical protein